MSGHTPAPWIEDYADLDTGIDIKAGDIVIATAWSGVEGMRANARLICASQDLLAALKRAVEVLDAEGIPYGNCDDEPLDVLSAGRAVIAKVEGGQ